jgi:hypothetical protein
VTRRALILFVALAEAGCSSCSKGKQAGATDAAPAVTPPASVSSAVLTPPPVDTTPALPPQDKVEGFEGDFEMKVEAPNLKKPAQVKVSVRGDRVAYDAPNRLQGHDAIAIYDASLRKMLLVNREDKVYVAIDVPPEAADAGAGMPLKPTGKKDKIDTMPCELWETTGVKKEKTTACIIDGVPFLDYGKLSNSAPTAPAWMQAMSGGKRFPARVVQTAEDGALVLRLETKFSKHPIAPFLLSVPAGYTRQRTPLGGSPLKPGRPD